MFERTPMLFLKKQFMACTFWHCPSFLLSGICLTSTLWADEWCRVYLLDQMCGWSMQVSFMGSVIFTWDSRFIDKNSYHYHPWAIRDTWGFDTWLCIWCIFSVDVTYLRHCYCHIPQWVVLFLQVLPVFISQIGNRKLLRVEMIVIEWASTLL